jgi:hypothetical protein
VGLSHLNAWITHPHPPLTILANFPDIQTPQMPNSMTGTESHDHDGSHKPSEPNTSLCELPTLPPTTTTEKLHDNLSGYTDGPRSHPWNGSYSYSPLPPTDVVAASSASTMFGAPTIPHSETPSQTHPSSREDCHADTIHMTEEREARDAEQAAEDEAYQKFLNCRAAWWNSVTTKKQRYRIAQRMSRPNRRSEQRDPKTPEEEKAYEIYEAARKRWEGSYTTAKRTQIENRARQRKVDRRGKARGSQKDASRDPGPSREDQMEDIVPAMTTEDVGMGNDKLGLDEESVNPGERTPLNDPSVAASPSLRDWWSTVM